MYINLNMLLYCSLNYSGLVLVYCCYLFISGNIRLVTLFYGHVKTSILMALIQHHYFHWINYVVSWNSANQCIVERLDAAHRYQNHQYDWLNQVS